MGCAGYISEEDGIMIVDGSSKDDDNMYEHSWLFYILQTIVTAFIIRNSHYS